jgi:hypothetical protein
MPKSFTEAERKKEGFGSVKSFFIKDGKHEEKTKRDRRLKNRISKAADLDSVAGDAEDEGEKTRPKDNRLRTKGARRAKRKGAPEVIPKRQANAKKTKPAATKSGATKRAYTDYSKDDRMKDAVSAWWKYVAEPLEEGKKR